jgi:hypothetical protein
MKTGQKIVFVRGEDPPHRSRETALVAAALVSGIKPAGDKPFLDTIEEVNGQAKRAVSWSLDGDGEITFRPAFPEETMDFAEFRRRFEDDAWCRDHPDHPISYLRALSDTLLDLQTQLRGRKPALLIRKGKRFAVIPPDAAPERKAEILDLLG